MDIQAYGRGYLCVTALLDAEDTPAGITLENGMTFAAGDLKLLSNRQPATALTAELAAFTSGSVEPSIGDTLTGNSSAETCIYIGAVLTSGSWAGGDAAGTMFVSNVSGVFTGAETINNTTESSTNDFTLTADWTPGIGAAVVSKSIAFALTADEMQMKWGQVEIVDQTATEVWMETTYPIQTVGHQDAMHGRDLIVTDVNDPAAEVTGFTVTKNAGSKVLYGICTILDGALKDESRVCSWTGYEIAVLGDSDMVAAEKEFSDAVADNVGISFKVGG